MYYSILYLTVVTQQWGAMFLLYNYQLSDMFRPYRAIIRLYKIMVLDKVHVVVLPAVSRGLQYTIYTKI